MIPAPKPPRLLRLLAALLVRGPEAPFVLGDLDEGYQRDLLHGARPLRAGIRPAPPPPP